MLPPSKDFNVKFSFVTSFTFSKWLKCISYWYLLIFQQMSLSWISWLKFTWQKYTLVDIHAIFATNLSGLQYFWLNTNYFLLNKYFILPDSIKNQSYGAFLTFQKNHFSLKFWSMILNEDIQQYIECWLIDKCPREKGEGLRHINPTNR